MVRDHGMLNSPSSWRGHIRDAQWPDPDRDHVRSRPLAARKAYLAATQRLPRVRVKDGAQPPSEVTLLENALRELRGTRSQEAGLAGRASFAAELPPPAPDAPSGQRQLIAIAKLSSVMLLVRPDEHAEATEPPVHDVGAAPHAVQAFVRSSGCSSRESPRARCRRRTPTP